LERIEPAPLEQILSSVLDSRGERPSGRRHTLPHCANERQKRTFVDRDELTSGFPQARPRVAGYR
jgi:hypothetical protein